MIPAELAEGLLDSWSFFIHLVVVLVPLFLTGSFLVGLVTEYLPPERVERMLRGHDEGLGNVAAAGLGAVTPFCSCSTVAVLAGLLQAGAPLGLAFSFLLASPLVNMVAVALLVGVFGPKVTLLYIAVTFAAAVVGGILIGRLGLEGGIKDAASGGLATDGGTTVCCNESSATTHRTHLVAAAREAASFFRDALPYLVLGITVGALVHGVVPRSMVHTVLGSGNPLAVPLAALVGAPVYLSLSAMLPLAASLSEQGVAIGTVLAFVIGGAGISLPNVILLSSLFKRRLLLVYAGTVVTIGILVGVVFNAVLV